MKGMSTNLLNIHHSDYNCQKVFKLKCNQSLCTYHMSHTYSLRIVFLLNIYSVNSKNFYLVKFKIYKAYGEQYNAKISIIC